MEQYLYQLKLKPYFQISENWTDKEDIINRHFIRLKKFTDEGKVILAGRTLNEDESQFGIVIFEDDQIALLGSTKAVGRAVLDSEFLAEDGNDQ